MAKGHYPTIRQLLCVCLSFFILKVKGQNLVQTPVTTDVNSSIGGYYECLPLDYSGSTDKKYPLLIFIHGIGEVGDGSASQLPKVLRNGPPKLIANKTFPNSFTVNNERFSFIVISPQFKTSYNNPDAVKSLIDYCVAKYRVDTSRIYLTGLSMGGGFCWNYASKSGYASRLASMLVVCGAYYPNTTGMKNMAAASLPVWATHNSGDPTVPSSYSVNWVNGLNNNLPTINPKALLNIFTANVHDAWTATYDPGFKPNGLNVYEWMLQYQRKSSQPAPNKLPQVNAGTDQSITLPINTVTLNGTASDPDGTIKSYAWTKISGPSCTITTPAAAQTSVTAMLQGTYMFRLTVTDNTGATASDTVSVMVNKAPNQLPAAHAGADQDITLPLNHVQLQGSGTDADGFIAGYKWTKVSGPATYLFNDSTLASPLISNLVAGTYTFRLTVTDSDGGTSFDEVTITVHPAPNKLPVVSAGSDIAITLPVNTTLLKGIASDSDGTINHYLWSMISGPAPSVINSPATDTTTISGLVAGTYVYRLMVTDNSGATSYDEVQVTVHPRINKVPVANAGAGQEITLPVNSVQLSGSGTDADGNIVTYKWTKISGPTSYSFSDSTSANPVVDQLIAGTYIFQLTVTDNDGATATSELSVLVHAAPNKKPVADAGKDLQITLPVNSVMLNGSGFDADGVVSGYRWSYISGPAAFVIQSPLKNNTSINGLSEGTYIFRLTVTDNAGDTAYADVQIVVHAKPNQRPVVNAGTDFSITLPVDSVQLSGMAEDSDGVIAKYIWTKISGPASYKFSDSTKADPVIRSLVAGTYGFQLKVVDNDGAEATDEITVVVRPAINKIPVADAGKDLEITLPVSSVTLTGSGKDVDGVLTGYKWSYVSGPAGYVIEDPAKNITSVSGLAEGVYTFRLTVTDNAGAVAYDDVQVVVNAKPNQHPVVDAGVDISIILPVDSVRLNGVASDSDGVVTKYLWTKISGPSSVSFSDSTVAAPTISSLLSGIYIFRLTVTDNTGATASDDVVVTVRDANNQPPVANAGADITITLPEDSVIVKGTGTDNDGQIASYQWRVVSAPAAYASTLFHQATIHLDQLIKGQYVLEFTVTDNKGASAKDTMVLTVHAAPNKKPVVDAGPDQQVVLPLDQITVAGTASDADGTIVKYQWAQVSGPSQSTISDRAQPQTTISNLVKGIYTFELKVTDNDGATAASRLQVTVYPAPNHAPVADAGADLTITLPQDSLKLTGKANDVDGNIASYRWSQISGLVQSSIANADHLETMVRSLKKGVYQFELTVTDDSGFVAKDTVQVNVQPAAAKPPVVNKAPVANAGPDMEVAADIDNVILTGSGSDADGTITSYKWSQISGFSPVIISSPSEARTSVSGLKPGAYQFELIVTDNLGATAKDTVKVIIDAPVVVPPLVLNAGEDQTLVLPEDSAALKATVNFISDRTVHFDWKMISGPAPVSFDAATAAGTEVRHLVAGEYRFVCTATDNYHSKASDTVSVIVKSLISSSAMVYPNPASDVVHIRVEANTTYNNTQLTIYNQLGNVVHYERYVRTKNIDERKIDISRLPRGVYFIEIGADINHKVTCKVVKQ